MSSQPTASSRALACLALVACLLPGCQGYSSDGGSGELVLTDLNTKVLPVDIEDDGDLKDVAYKSKSQYKPATAAVGNSKKDPRLLLTAKKDGAALRATLQRDFVAATFTTHVRVAVDPAKLTGLEDDTSYAFFEFILDNSGTGDGALPLRRLEAVYDADAGGFQVRATDGTSGLGTPITFDGTDELVLQVRSNGATLFLEAGPPTGTFHSSFEVNEIHSEPLVDGGGLVHTLAWGAAELGKKARLYFNNLALSGPYPDIGTAETPIAQALADAWADTRTAEFSGNLAAATAAIEAARDLLTTAVADLDTAITDGTLEAVTRGDLAAKSAGKALKAAVKAAAAGNKQLAKGKTSAKSVNKQSRKIDKAIQVALAQMAGYRSKSYGRLLKSGFFPFF